MAPLIFTLCGGFATLNVFYSDRRLFWGKNYWNKESGEVTSFANVDRREKPKHSVCHSLTATGTGLSAVH